MSLTPQAVKERVWGPFPTLRAILETKALPESYFGSSSASNNIFEELQRLLEIAIIVKENATAIAESSKAEVRGQRLLTDLRHLQEAYRLPMTIFQDASEEIERIVRKVRENC